MVNGQVVRLDQQTVGFTSVAPFKLMKDLGGSVHLDEEAELMGRCCRHWVDVVIDPLYTPWPIPVRPQCRRAGLARPDLHQHQHPHPVDCWPGGSGHPPILCEEEKCLDEGRRTQPAQSV